MSQTPSATERKAPAAAPTTSPAAKPEAKVDATTGKPRPPSNVLPINFDLLGIESIKKELQQLSATNQELLKAFQSRPELPPAKPKEFGSSGNIVLPPQAEELAKLKKDAEQFKRDSEQFKKVNEQIKHAYIALKKENEALQRRILELEEKAKADAPTAWQEQQREFDQILEEKSEAIRRLHMQVHELQEALRGGPQGPTAEQLDQRQLVLDQLEQRLLADEEALNMQAREMEMSMAKERAELARQRAELQRMHADVQREVELASRDPGLRERLANLQRRPDGRPKTMSSLPDINLGNAPTPQPTPASTQQRPARPATMASMPAFEEQPESPQKKGVLRRLFGG